MKILTKCLYCGYSKDFDFKKCPKCTESKHIKKVKVVVDDYYKTNKKEDEKDMSIDFDAMLEYYNNKED